MSLPLKIGVIHVTYHSMADSIHEAKVMERAGFDTLWLGEAYPWWRSSGGLEPRSATALSAVIARETKDLTIGWGIVSPYARHPLLLAAEARITQEAAGPGRFLLGLGASKILMNAIGEGDRKPARPYTAVKETIEIVSALLEGEGVDFDGREFRAQAPPMSEESDAPRYRVPIYIAATGPRLQKLAGEVADGMLTAGLTTPAFVKYARENVAKGAAISGRDAATVDIGSTLIASIDERDRDRGRAGAREIAGMYIANKVRNIKGSAEVLLDLAGLTRDEVEPIADALDRGGRQAAGAMVTDEILDKCKPIAGTPNDCIAAIEEYHAAGCTHVMLELWGKDRERQLELFGKHVLPHFR